MPDRIDAKLSELERTDRRWRKAQVAVLGGMSVAGLIFTVTLAVNSAQVSGAAKSTGVTTARLERSVARLEGSVATLQADNEALRARAEANRRINEANFQSLEIIKAVTNCTGAEPPEVCQKRLADSSMKEGDRRIDEVDCRVRRALAGKPPPAAGGSCAKELR